MKHTLFFLLFSLSFEFGTWNLKLETWDLGLRTCSAQSITPEVISPAGDYFINGSNALSWTLGEPVIETFSSANNKISQGFQQPYYIVTDITENKNEQLQISVFPNPVAEYINISINGSGQNSPFTIELLDATGKLVLQSHVYNPSSTIQFPLDKLPVATYFLNIYSSEKTIFKTYKIQKTL